MSTVCLPNNVTCLSTRVKQMIMREFANNLIETDVSAEEAVINDTVYDKLAASIVVDSTTKKTLKKYELYDNKICTGDEAAECRHCIENRINIAGYVLDMSRGDNINWARK